MKIVVNVAQDFMIMDKKNAFYAKIQFRIARLAKVAFNVQNALITQFGTKKIKNVNVLYVIAYFKNKYLKSIFYQNHLKHLKFVAKLVSNACLTVKNAKVMAHAKNIKNAKMDNIDHNKHKNVQMFAKMIKLVCIVF